ncbi:hypothetical protein Bca52824_032527 [Brassica carinata]|uniref:Uncharacterized protein n=1 Tax=Brassica carinata TaxID=52824 RepID=A0A8X7V8R2_BRACI|nr:hypothetical protein Bca52824_032527 [Brassica carinata]
MAAAAIFSSLRRRRCPITRSLFNPPLTSPASSLSSKPYLPSPQRSRSSSSLNHALPQELYLLLYRSKTLLLEYVAQSSKLWLLLQSPSISTLFDVNDLNLTDDIRELLQRQSLKSRLYIDNNDAKHYTPFSTHSRRVRFRTSKLSIKDSESFVDFLEEQIVNHDEPASSVINGFVAVTRYCRFLLFGFEERRRIENHPKVGGGDVIITSVPKDFVCSEAGQTVAAREIRLLAKTVKENRAFIAEAGAIPHLRRLLKSGNAIAQENSVMAMLNLSIYEKNKRKTIWKRRRMQRPRCSLSLRYKKRIAFTDQCVEALSNGTPRGKKDAVTALYNLSTHPDNCRALALLVRQSLGAEAIGKEEAAVTGLMGMMRCGTPSGKENAVAALLELCRSGGAAAAEKVLRAPAISGLLLRLLAFFRGGNMRR